MNKMRDTALFAARLLVIVTFVSPPVLSQKQNPGVQSPPAPPGQSRFSLADGNGILNADSSNSLTCGPTSGSAFQVQGRFISIKFSFGLSDQFLARPVGSWTVRSIFPAKGSRPKTVVAYYFDGKFESGAVGRNRPENAVSFYLVGRTTFSGLCTPPGHADYTSHRYVSIYGLCGGNQEIGFEVTDRPRIYLGDPPVLYASGTFRGDVTCVVGNGAVNRVRTTLDAH